MEKPKVVLVHPGPVEKVYHYRLKFEEAILGKEEPYQTNIVVAWKANPADCRRAALVVALGHVPEVWVKYAVKPKSAVYLNHRFSAESNIQTLIQMIAKEYTRSQS